MKTIITRTSWCPHCNKAQRPRTGNFFVVKGKDWHILKASHIGNTGFVPTLYKLVKVVGDNIQYEKMCAMNNCGVEVFHVPSTGLYDYRLGEWERGTMTIEAWNAMCKYKKDLDYHIEGEDFL